MMYDVMKRIKSMSETNTEIEVDCTEIDKLIIGLAKRNYPFVTKKMYGGWQILCDSWDAICHLGSYGHENGLLEIYGSIVQNENDTVEGYLTAEEILERL